MRYVIGVIAVVATISASCNRGTPVTATAPSSFAAASETGTSRSAVSSISIAGTSTLSRGSRVQFRSFARLADGGQEDVTSKTVWGVDTPSVARIEPDGWITGINDGASRVSARYENAEAAVVVTVAGESTSGSSGGTSSSGGSSSSSNSSGGGSSSNSSGSGSTGGTSPGSPSETTPCLPSPIPSEIPPRPIPCPVPLPLPQ